MADPMTGPQLRDAIDSGKTGEKVAFPDPAAAPLETDAEAGGTPTTFAAAPQPRPRHQAPGFPAIGMFFALGFAVNLCVLVSVLIGTT